MTRSASYFQADTCDLEAFKMLTSQQLNATDVPLACDIQKNVPIYDIPALAPKLGDPSGRIEIMSEWAWVLRDGAGALALKNACPDLAAIDRVSEIYNNIIASEKGGGADHFASAGSNDRIWNSLQKLCEASPQSFAAYFATPAIDTVCEAWLGPGYQMTAQVNVVRPGGQAQQAHRDYHLGFQTAEKSAAYPAHVHDLSPVLTLQGAIAHCDMPLQSGPTKLLPFSQSYREGYAAWRRDDFRAYFEETCVQLPLSKGDALFFNPALFHGAGENVSKDIQRMANLLQISSPFGRAMEVIDRAKMCRLLFPVLSESNAFSDMQLNAIIAACAEGYSFPTNLDTDPPVGGLAPETQQALFHRALMDGMTAAEFDTALTKQANRQRA